MTWSPRHYFVLFVMTFIACRFVHQEVRIWHQTKAMEIKGSPYRLHQGGHEMITQVGPNGQPRQVVVTHLDGPYRDDLHTRYVYHSGE